jgi:hypothetical protein
MAQFTRRKVLVALAGSAASAALARSVLTRGRAAAPAAGRGQPTSFGSVALLGWSRLALAPSSPGHHHGPASGAPVPSAVHGAWTDAVEVDVAVHNGSRQQMELSPGQFRMRLDDGGPTVSLYRADRAPGPLAPGSTATMRISYLAPAPDHGLSLEFDDAAVMTTLAVGRLDDAGRRA